MEEYLHQHNVTIRQSNDSIRGRYIQANSLIPKGTTFITSQPLGAVCLPQTTNECCNYCFRKKATTLLQRCSRCKKAYFCDMGCFKNAWLSYHQFVCSATPTNTDAEYDMELEMLERVALNVSRYNERQQQSDKKTMDKPMDDVSEETVDVTMQAFFSLMGHDQLQHKHIILRYKEIVKAALSKSHIKQTHLTEQDLMHYLCVFQSNNFGINDEDMFPIGEGTYPVASLFNHSCRPNAIVIFDGALANIRAIEDIAEGSEITIAYTDAAHSRTYRQKSLKDKYFFTCRCDRCHTNNKSKKRYLSLVDTLLGEEVSDWDRAQSLLGTNKDIEATTILEEVKEWDLLEMCKLYDRKHGTMPDPKYPLTIASFTHCFLQFLAPYLLTWNNLKLHQQSSRSAMTSLTDFDDPSPSLAKPTVPATYDDIMETAIHKMMSYPTTTSTIIPYRLSTLTVCSRLFYDEMAAGRWEHAVKLGMYIVVQYCLIYPPYHPILAQHCLMLSKCCWNSIIQLEMLVDGKQLEKVYERGVRRWIVTCKETVSVSFGKYSHLWRETLELEWLFLREQKLK
ncbi:hypothetical protein BDB01DRAFT_841026 [Pilobolus umbonatus]|nr:hypothetical protein BDB01DRAFT_841026 [Pilobolus umbonatus]